MVDFEGGNAQNPYVLGTQYNGSQSSGYADGQNNVKAIHTRSGPKIILNDAEGSILIEDPSGNTWRMDGQGNINEKYYFNAKVIEEVAEKVEIVATEKNITLASNKKVIVKGNKY